jgi:hypothetical protein
MTMTNELNQHDHEEMITNMQHQHAFVMVGRQHPFGVHMTQYHCEIHKYQIIIKLVLPEEVRMEMERLHDAFPDDCFMLCNQPGHKVGEVYNFFSIPELACGDVKEFHADIFQGLRPPSDAESRIPHFFPWNLERCKPVIASVIVKVERVVLFRPFDHHRQLPEFATYLIFGEQHEAHMTNLQTAALATSPFEPPAFGPDYDHVMSLNAPVDWLEPSMLKAGIVVTVPKIPLIDPVSGEPTIPCKKIFTPGEEFEVVYRGLTPVKKAIAGRTYLQCTAVCNGPAHSISTAKVMPCKCEPSEACHISIMPKVYWVL